MLLLATKKAVNVLRETKSLRIYAGRDSAFSVILLQLPRLRHALGASLLLRNVYMTPIDH